MYLVSLLCLIAGAEPILNEESKQKLEGLQNKLHDLQRQEALEAEPLQIEAATKPGEIKGSDEEKDEEEDDDLAKNLQDEGALIERRSSHKEAGGYKLLGDTQFSPANFGRVNSAMLH